MIIMILISPLSFECNDAECVLMMMIHGDDDVPVEMIQIDSGRVV